MILDLSKKVFSCVVLFFLFSFGSIQAFSQTSTNTSLDIANSNLVLGQFEIIPEKILIGQDLTFTLFDVKLDNGSIAVGLTCIMDLTAPDNSNVVLEMIVQQDGTCSYDNSMSLIDQGVTLVSGDVANLNGSVGFGSGFVDVVFQGNTVRSNTDTYEVEDIEQLVLETPVFEIIPQSILINEELSFRLTGGRFSNGDIADGLECRLFLTPPQNRPIVEVAGTTDSQGECIFVLDAKTSNLFSVDTFAQNIFTVAAGDTDDLHARIGDGFGYGEVYYENVAYRSNSDDYEVGTEDIVEIIIRTGGQFSYLIILLLVALISAGVYISLRKNEKESS